MQNCKQTHHHGNCLHRVHHASTTLRVSFYIVYFLLLLPPATKLGQVYIFTGVCDSVQGGCLVRDGACSQRVCSRGCLVWGCLVRGGLLPGGSGLGGAWWRPPQGGYCCMWYASYWNAFLYSGRGVPGGDPFGMATAAGSTHPTGMHSCIRLTKWMN